MNVLVCIHHPLEGPDVFGQVLDREGIAWEKLEFFCDPNRKVSSNDYTHLIIMGGAMNVDETEAYPFLQYERELIRDFISRNRPVLGICLGAQLIASALGAPVYKNSVPEIGWFPVELTAAGAQDPLLGEAGSVEFVFQWHGDTFDLPRGGEWLAKSELCAHQAFRYGRQVYALQYHLEVSAETAELWLAEIKDETERQRISAQTGKHADRANDLARSFFLKWLALG